MLSSITPPGRRPRERLRAVLWAFFDESGEYKSSEFLCVCGFVAGENAPYSWDKFATEWHAQLLKHQIPYLHCSPLFAMKGPYSGRSWDVEQRQSLLSDFARVITSNAYFGVGVGLDAAYFRSLEGRQRKKLEEKKPEKFLFRRLMRLIVKFLEKIDYQDPISLTFDWSEDAANLCLGPLTHLIRNRPEIKKRISSIAFADDEQHYPLQAADLLCFATKRALDGREDEFKKVLTLGDATVSPCHYISELWDKDAIDRVLAPLFLGGPDAGPLIEGSFA